MQKKLMPHRGKPANYTLRFTKDVSSAIRERANALNMSQSYYVAALFELDTKLDLFEKLGDPFDPPDGGVSAIAAEHQTDLQVEIDRRQTEIDSIRAQLGGQTPTRKPEPQRRPIVPPKMTSLNELLLQDRGGQKVRSGPSTGGAMLRQMQQQQLKEEQQERELRRKILEDLPKEEDDG